LRRASVAHRRLALALSAAVLTSLVLVASAPFSERLLVAAAPFFAALVGLVADAAWQPSRARALRVAATLAVVMLLIASLLRAGFEAGALARATRTLPRWHAPAAFDACAEPEHDHLLLAAGGFSTVHVAPVLADALGCETPRSWRVLTLPTGALVALRTGPRSLTLSAQGNTVLLRDEARLWHRGYVAHIGDVVRLQGFEARVLAVRDGLPTQLAFAFDRSLDDARVSLWMATPDGFARVPAPPVGAGTFVPQPTEHFP
jgi:hypothetical protein